MSTLWRPPEPPQRVALLPSDPCDTFIGVKTGRAFNRAVVFGVSLAIASATLSPDTFAAKSKPRRVLSPKSDACSAAYRKVNYKKIVPVPAKLKKYIRVYKKSWQKLCKGKGKKLNVSLHKLMLKAKVIQKSFLYIFPRVHRQALNLKKAKKARVSKKKTRGFYKRVHRVLSNIYPAFIPAFEGSILEYEYFRPSTREFHRNLARGSSEDRMFFKNYGLLRKGDFYPWLKRTWAYGGCIKFGEYKWLSTFKRLEKLRKHINGKVYRRLLANLETDIMKSLASPRGPKGKYYPICTCESKKAVVKDLRKIKRYFASNKRYTQHATMIDELIDGVKSKKIAIKSEAKNECSGNSSHARVFNTQTAGI